MLRETNLITIIREVGSSIGEIISHSYSRARKLIEEENCFKEENDEAIRLLNRVNDGLDATVGILGNLEHAKYLAFKAGKEEDGSDEQSELYEQSKSVLRDVLGKEPKFKGAQTYLNMFEAEKPGQSLEDLSRSIQDEVLVLTDTEGSMEDEVLALARGLRSEPKQYGQSLGAKFDFFYSLARSIIEEGDGQRSDGEEGKQLLGLAKHQVKSTIGLLGSLEYARWIVYDARNKDPAEKAAAYDMSKKILGKILKLEPKFKGAQVCLEQYTREADQLSE